MKKMLHGKVTEERQRQRKGMLMWFLKNGCTAEAFGSSSGRRKGISRRKKMLSIASSCYSGSAERCGDNCGWTELADRKFAVVLSDGTGKGERAAQESSRTVNAVLGLLKAGTDPELTLQILNLIMSMDNKKEHFPTVDLAIVDMASRELTIYKIGAAPTIIRRMPMYNPPGKTEILTAPAMPMGVSENSEIPCISTLIMPGDRIVMMTDGIADSKRSDPELTWMRRLLTGIKSRNLQTVSDLIIREAALNYGSREKDDMTVAIFGI